MASPAPTLFFSPAADAMGAALARALSAEVGQLELRRFPDGESYVRVLGDPAGRDAVVVQGLHRPDETAVGLLLLADTLRDLGAARVGLVAPYLAYLRQDARFRPGEGVTSRYFAALLSAHFDWLLTVDPHLHRYASLAEVYRIPTRVVEAMPVVARWIAAKVENPLVVGPDRESAQWVQRVAGLAGCPWRVLEKRRLGDRDVEIRVPPLQGVEGCTPVLVDDILSSGHTMAVAAEALVAAGLRRPVGVAVHALFSEGAWERLQQAPLQRVVTCDTVAHPSNGIALASAIAEGLAASGLLAPLPG